MVDIIVLPGIGNSAETHWQTHWERRHQAMRRFSPANWNNPELIDWIEALDCAVDACAASPLLIAHSLAGLLVAHWRQASMKPIAGAFLVAVPDTVSAAFPAEAAGFSDVPTKRFDFPTLMIASSNDPFGTLDYARYRAAQWGAGLIELGPLGHINGAGGLGDWREGLNLLYAFMAGCGINDWLRSHAFITQFE
jgi:predicted alpha/beta hydrolase family esterase